MKQNSNKNNKRLVYIIVGVLFVVCLCLGSFYVGNIFATKGVVLASTNSKVNSTFKEFNDVNKYKELFQVRDALVKNYDGEINDEVALEGAIKGMVNSLGDPYTVYMNKNEFKKFNEQNSGEYMGIGVYVGVKDGKVTVISPIDGSPAAKAGIKSDDVIIAVNGEKVGADVEKATSLITGKKKEQITLTIQRGKESPFDVKVMRDTIKTDSVKGEMIQKDVGYIQITSFNANVTEDFKKEIEALKSKGMKGMILDLRGNPGGYLSEAVGVASQFIPKGKLITYTVDKYDNKTEEVSKGGIAEGMPLVVLVDGGSASASEVVTGALRDYKAATIVGTNTFGKGIVQAPVQFDDGSALKVTISKYYTPNGENIHHKGIKPDDVVEIPKELLNKPYSKDKDNQLKKALEVIDNKINK
ncbi:S41 family peptidase [Clostridium sardiniense]|uniref:S41 family peptidase n=1 Tax=Clostridium sardiniense TaxID=29369 RepID=UPI003D3445B7